MSRGADLLFNGFNILDSSCSIVRPDCLPRRQAMVSIGSTVVVVMVRMMMMMLVVVVILLLVVVVDDPCWRRQISDDLLFFCVD